MKIFFVITSIILTFGLIFSTMAGAESVSGNTLFETMHIKQMAKRNFTNKGATKYVYVDKNSKNGQQYINSVNCYKPLFAAGSSMEKWNRQQHRNLPACNTLEIGAVHLKKNSRVQQLHIAVDMSKPGHISQRKTPGKVSIAPVYGAGSRLKKINIVVHGNQRVRY